jgi:hypothetical protein
MTPSFSVPAATLGAFDVVAGPNGSKSEQQDRSPVPPRGTHRTDIHPPSYGLTDYDACRSHTGSHTGHGARPSGRVPPPYEDTRRGRRAPLNKRRKPFSRLSSHTPENGRWRARGGSLERLTPPPLRLLMVDYLWLSTISGAKSFFCPRHWGIMPSPMPGANKAPWGR